MWNSWRLSCTWSSSSRRPTEQFDLLLPTVPKPHRVHADGIRFQGLRHVAPTPAAYVGEPVTIRYDLRDRAEIRVFYQDRFLSTCGSGSSTGADCGEEELRFVLTRRWAELGLAFAHDDKTDAQAMVAITCITGGNFR